MRWIWIDAFVEFVSGQRAVAVKNVTLAEEYLHDHFPGYPIMPPSLMIEGMAQTAGILVGEVRDFKENVILAKIRLAEFREYPRPGDQIRYETTIDSFDDRAAVTSGTVFRNDKNIGRVDLIFSHVNNVGRSVDLPAHNFVFTEQFQHLVATARNLGSNVDRKPDEQ